MPGPLQGITVVELPAIGPVPFLGMLLADLGAEVIRFQKPKSKRNFLEESFARPPLGRGRRDIEIDLREAAAAEAVLAEVADADALIEGFRPGVAERLGVGPEPALARNPRLVYGRMTGWGQDGPLAKTAGHDITYLAISGLLHGIGEKDRAPVPPINYVADFGGGSMFLATGLLAAILQARTTGAGQVVDAAMVEGAAYLGSMTAAFLGTGLWQDERGVNLLDGGMPHYRCYECSDGRYVAVGALEPQFWSALCAGLGLDEAAVGSPQDPAVRADLTALLAGRFAERTRDEWAEHFAPTDACVAPVLSLTEAPHHPHAVARGGYAPVAGVLMPRFAPRFSGAAD